MTAVVLGQDQVSKQVPYRDRSRCFMSGQYDHLAKDCQNVPVTEKDRTEQMQIILDSQEKGTTLKVLTGKTYDSLTRANL